MNNVPFDIFEEVEKVETVGIAGHVRPDGDCVGSTLGLYNDLVEYFPNKDIRIYLEPIPNIFKFMKNSDKIQAAGEDMIFDLFICLDCSAIDRLGAASKYFETAKQTICIDHHLSNGDFADMNYIVPDASAASELVYDVICSRDFSKEVAECLYTGIVHDTGVFQYSCTSSTTMTVAGKLMDKGIDYSKIIDESFFMKTFGQHQIFATAVDNARLYADGRIIVSKITRDEMARCSVQYKELDGIVSQLRSTKGVEIALFVYENEDGSYKASTRAKNDINLVEVASKYNGGGHAKAAGFTLVGDIDVLLEEVLKKLEGLL